MPGWRYLHTPGHTPGHISLWRDHDRSLIAGDAFITTRQESAYAVLTQKPEIHGPPMYFTPNWELAEESVMKLAALQPELVVTGHGPAMQGAAMQEALSTLARNFKQIAVPEDGRYVDSPAHADATGVTYVPPKR
jgi:glyoxylase-like metal-dependent hydrolase (beta-lactamase superfamily II)